MADVRATSGVPVAANFAGLGAPTVCAPVVVDTATGDLYTLATGDAVKVAGNVVLSGAGAPGSTPARVGQFYVDTSGDKLYFSTGTASSSDWIAAN